MGNALTAAVLAAFAGAWLGNRLADQSDPAPGAAPGDPDAPGHRRGPGERPDLTGNLAITDGGFEMLQENQKNRRNRLTAMPGGKHLEPPPWLYARLAQGSLMRLIYRRLIADLAGSLPPGTRLLDVGTGPGYLLGYLARARPDLSLWGLDFSYDMIRRARPRQRATGAPGGAPVAGGRRLPPAISGRGLRPGRRHLQLPHLALPGGRAQGAAAGPGARRPGLGL